MERLSCFESSEMIGTILIVATDPDAQSRRWCLLSLRYLELSNGSFTIVDSRDSEEFARPDISSFASSNLEGNLCIFGRVLRVE